MCGRYQLVLPAEDMAALFDLDRSPEHFPPRYNVAPTQPVHVVHTAPNKGRYASLMRWGFVPAWAKDPKNFSLIINARSETAADKPAFRHALRRRRALLPASGFYEWARLGEGQAKRPYLFETGAPFALAGLWECWLGPNGEEIDTVAILTAEAVGLPARYHHRMPLTVPADAWSAWLDPFFEDGAAALTLTERTTFTARPVSKRLSHARNEGAGLLNAEDGADQAAGARVKDAENTVEAHEDDAQPRLL